MIETLYDLYCFQVTACKYDRLAQLIAAVNPQSIFHQVAKHGVYRTKIDNTSADFAAVYLCTGVIGSFLAVGSEFFFKLLFLFFRKIVIFDATLHGFGGSVKNGEAHKIVVGNGFFQLVCHIGFVIFQGEYLIGALVFLRSRRSGKTEHQCIKVMKECSVLLENGTMCFVNNDKIKSADTKLFLFIVDKTDHCLIGRENHTGIFITVHTAARIY